MEEVIQGNIPDAVVIISSGPQPITNPWEDFENADREREEVIPAFVAEAGNSRTVATGVSWAERRRPYYRDASGRWEHRDPGPVEQIVRENRPLDGYRVAGLEIRSEGGRAYKVVSPGEVPYYFDLREDVLLDALLTVGTGEHGFLNGRYLWARVRQTMKLVREGSELHAMLIAATRRGVAGKVPARDLKPGWVYRSKGGKLALFGGLVDTVEAERVERTRRGSWGQTETYLVGMVPKEIKRGQLWMKIPEYGGPSQAGPAELAHERVGKLGVTSWGFYDFSVTRGHSMTEEVCDSGLGDALIERVRSEVRIRIGSPQDSRNIPEVLVLRSVFANMAPAGQGVDLDPRYETFFAASAGRGTPESPGKVP